MLAALGSWLLARHAGAEWWLRIEDLDPPRSVPGATERQLAQLAACGLHHDGEVCWQSRRTAAYQRAIEALMDRGLAFECHCSRSDLDAEGGVHRHCVPGQRRREPSIRLRVEDHSVVHFDDAIRGPQVQDVAGAVGDVVLRRTDGLFAYQLAVVVDDAACGITQVVRGADLLDSTPRQILLQRALALPTPRYAHLPLLLDAAGHKLSKSAGADAADTPLAVLAAAWRALGQGALPVMASPQARLARALECFEPARIPSHDLALATTF
jgi:glutamyl-Q tRNA(Asp) synthetase